MDDAFTGNTLVGRVEATAARYRALLDERDALKLEIEALEAKLARTSEGRVMSLVDELAAPLLGAHSDSETYFPIRPHRPRAPRRRWR